MLGGFGIDNLTFGRIDRPAANIIFSAYLVLAAGTIAFLHLLQSRADRKLEEAAAHPEREVADVAPQKELLRTRLGRRLHGLLPAATQFTLGGLWSGFLVFYARSAVVAASWPFLLVLTAVFIGNEIFKQYRTRLVFCSLLLFFALYSWAIFFLPVALGHMGTFVFLLSAVLAVFLFALFLRVLRAFGAKRYWQSRLYIHLGAIAILAAMNLFYFTDILPPLPLALENEGVFHSVKRAGDVYTATTEPQPMTTMFDISKPVMHVVPGQSLSVYSAIFAPVTLKTRIFNGWHWYDEKKKRWVLLSTVSYAIAGGREGGYRGYTIKSNPRPGAWRVDIATDDGRLIGRVAFDVASVTTPVATTQKTIQ